MIPFPNIKVEKYRVHNPPWNTYIIPSPGTRCNLQVIASDGGGFDHVSVTVEGVDRCPTWTEMDAVKRLFWDDEEAVMQLHPPRSQWVNNHRYCLHLWRPNRGEAIPLPDELMVGFKALGTLPRLK